MNKKIKLEDKWIYIIMIILGILVYILPGEWISIEDDSIGYLAADGQLGVMPAYPVFLSFFRTILGEKHYLDGVVLAQSILAIVCTLFFVRTLWKQYRLKGWECILLYIACMLPFTIYLPESGITHQIMTEGIAYAIFYLFFIMVLKAIWTVRLRWYFGAAAVAVLLGLTRSQMLFLQAVCICLLAGMMCKRSKGNGRKKRILLTLGALVFSFVFALLSVKAIYSLLACYENRVMGQEEQAASEDGTLEQSDKIEPDGGEAWEEEPEQADERNMSQIDSLIIIRGFFEADETDVDLFEDEMMKDIFRRVYQRADETQLLYPYAKPGLYMWQDLVHDGFGAIAWEAIDAYDREYPGVRERDGGSITRELGLRVLFAHFDRYLYHTLRIMIPSFIASVFFQIQPIYFLCHIITLVIYLTAITGCILCKKVGGNRAAVEFMAAVLVFLFLMVLIINMVFLGLQRYTVYGMGIFYCALYVLYREIFIKAGIWGKLGQLRGMKKSR